MKKTTVVLMVILLIVAVGLIYFLIPKNKVSETDKLAQACRDHNGTWLATYQECEYADKDWCFSVGGNYNECASACRHNADKTGACTMQCVQVCSFGDQSATTESMGSDAKNSTYIIEGKSVTLEDGYLEQEIAPGSASKTVTQFFGQTPVGDLDGNGELEIVINCATYTACIDLEGNEKWLNSGGEERGYIMGISNLDSNFSNLEVLVSDFSNNIICLNYAGEQMWSKTLSGSFGGYINFVDFNKDGIYEILSLTSNLIIQYLSNEGDIIWSYDEIVDECNGFGLCVADVDGDSELEILFLKLLQKLQYHKSLITKDY